MGPKLAWEEFLRHSPAHVRSTFSCGVTLKEGTHFAISLPIIFNPNQNGENSCDMAPRPRGVEYSSLKIFYFEVPLGFPSQVLLRDILAFIVKLLSFGQAKFKFCFAVLKIYVQRHQCVALLRDLGTEF